MSRDGLKVGITTDIADILCLDFLFLQTELDIIKIDVKGTAKLEELEVFRDMRNILENRSTKIILEIHPNLLLSLRHKTKEVENLLKSYGCRRYDKRG